MNEAPSARQAWVKEFPAAVTVCDKDGIIVDLNDAAARDFAANGGHALLGRQILDCHPGPCAANLTRLLESRRPNIYTIQKDGRRKIIVQVPWTRDGEHAGYVEMDLEIPWDMPHFNRDQAGPPASTPAGAEEK